MAVFKILLIILMGSPIVLLAAFFYFQMIDFIRGRNREEKIRRQR